MGEGANWGEEDSEQSEVKNVGGAKEKLFISQVILRNKGLGDPV